MLLKVEKKHKIRNSQKTCLPSCILRQTFAIMNDRGKLMLKNKENYLDYIPRHNSLHETFKNKDGHIVIKVKNRGLYNRIAQLFFKRPTFSNIELDDFGSFVWECIDGNTSIYKIGSPVKEKFGEKAEPLYPRLTQFIKTLHNNGYIVYANKIKNKKGGTPWAY